MALAGPCDFHEDDASGFAASRVPIKVAAALEPGGRKPCREFQPNWECSFASGFLRVRFAKGLHKKEKSCLKVSILRPQTSRKKSGPRIMASIERKIGDAILAWIRSRRDSPSALDSDSGGTS